MKNRDERSMDRVDEISALVADKAREAIRSSYGTIRAEKEFIKDVEKAWKEWDWRDLERLGLISRRDADFARKTLAEFTWERVAPMPGRHASDSLTRTQLIRIASDLPKGDPDRRRILAILASYDREASLKDNLFGMDEEVELVFNPFTGFVQVGMGGEWWSRTIKGLGSYVIHHRKEKVDPGYRPVKLQVIKRGSEIRFNISGGFGYIASFALKIL